MEVFHCLAPPEKKIPTYNGSCFAPERPTSTEVCKRVLAAWAMGATAFTYPEVECGIYIPIIKLRNGTFFLSGISNVSGSGFAYWWERL